MVHSHLREILRFAFAGAVTTEANQNKTWVGLQETFAYAQRKFLKFQTGVYAPLLHVSV